MSTTIHTGFYSDDAFKLFTKFFKESDAGRFGRRASRTADVTTVIQEPDGETVLSYDYSSRSVYSKKHGDVGEILDWIGWMMKCSTHEELGRKGDSKHEAWKRDNHHYVVECLSTRSNVDDAAFDCKVTIADVYYVYDALKNRKNIDKKYSAELVEKWRGKQRDPIATEAERARREEVAKLTKDYDAKIANCSWEGYTYSWRASGSEAASELKAAYEVLKKKFDADVKAMEESLGGKWKKEAKRLEAEKKAKIAEINEAMDVMKMLGI